MSTVRTPVFLVVLAIGADVGAQITPPPVSLSVFPAIAQPGSSPTVSMTTLQTVTFPGPNYFGDVRFGSPTGTPVWTLPPGNWPGPVTLLPLTSVSSSIWVPMTASPGFYWVQCRTVTPTGVQRDTFVCFEVRVPTIQGGSVLFPGPILFQQSTAWIGTLFPLGLADSSSAGAFYIVSAALTCDTGINVGPSLLCLDQDWLFNLAWPAPAPSAFGGFQGWLNAAGAATGITLSIPTDPTLAYWPLRFQAIIVQPTGLTASNPLSTQVQP